VTERPLKILNARHVSTWAKYENAPAALVPEEHSRHPCDKCPGHCCHHTCHVSAYEAARISLTLNLEMERFVEPERYEPAPEYQGVAVCHPIELGGGAPVRLRFRQIGDGNAPCVFLIGHVGVGRCSIYALRPGICRQYPFHVEDELGVVEVGNMNLCAPSWLYDEANEAALSTSLAQWRADLERDNELVARWNAEHSDKTRFAEFCQWIVRETAEELGGDPDRVYPRPRRRLGQR
jgi:Fe-S-cluster containining protein